MRYAAVIAILLPVALHAAGTPASLAPAPQLQVISGGTVQYEKAQGLFNQGQYTAAISEYSQLAKNYPNDPHKEEALFRIGECYRLLKQPKDAQEAYRYFIGNCPNSLFVPNAQLRLGTLLADSGKYDEAAAALQTAMDKGDSATKMSAKYYLGAADLQGGKTQAGQQLLEGLLQDNAAANYAAAAGQALAQSYEKQEKWADALRAWSKVLSSSDSKALQACAAARGGWAALQLKNAKEAETLFETCRRLESSGSWRTLANTGLVRLYINQKRNADLLTIYSQEKDAFLAAGRAEILFGISMAQFELKKWPDVVATCDLFLKEFPQSEGANLAAYKRLSARAQIDPAFLLTDCAPFLEKYPQSSLAPAVQFLYAQSLSAKGDFTTALPYWKKLAEGKSGNLPENVILFEYGRALESAKNWVNAAEIYDEFLNNYPQDPRALNAQARQAASLQNAGQEGPAIAVWEKVRKAAVNGPEKQTALEQLGLLYGKQDHKAEMVGAFSELMTIYPNTRLRPLAIYSIGQWAFDRKDYAHAEAPLLEARKLDAETFYLSATERLALIAFAQKDTGKLSNLVGQYDEARLKKNANAPRLPAPLYFWLGEAKEKEKKYAEAASYFGAVTSHPRAGELGIAAYWRLAECQRALKNYTAAVVNYEAYRKLSPKMANSPEVMVALAQANLGAGNYDQAKELADQTMLADLDGKWNAAARNVAGEVFFRQGQYMEAAKAFTTLGLLYDDPAITPQAMFRAAQSYDKAGNAASAAEWRDKLKKKYPTWQPTGDLITK